MAPDFRLLGLRPREARLDVIRQALKETASDVKAGEQWTSGEDDQLARVATAGYRLLDPRRRRALFERVQLLLWTEEDLDPAPGSLWDVQPSASTADRTQEVKPARIVAKPVGSSLPPPVSESAPTGTRSVRAKRNAAQADEDQTALELFRSMRSRDRQAKILWISLAALALSLTLALSLVTAIIL